MSSACWSFGRIGLSNTIGSRKYVAEYWMVGSRSIRVMLNVLSRKLLYRSLRGLVSSSKYREEYGNSLTIYLLWKKPISRPSTKYKNAQTTNLP